MTRGEIAPVRAEPGPSRTAAATSPSAWSWQRSAASGSCGTWARRPPRDAHPTPDRCWSAPSAAVPSSYGVATRVLLWMRRPIRCTTTEAASAARPIAMVIGSR